MPNPVTNFIDSFGTDLGNKLITKDYLLSVYPSIAQQIGKTPELWTWGIGSSGALGTNETIARSTPVTTFAGGTNWEQVSCGDGFTAAIKTDGTLWTWGSNTQGSLGINNTTSRSTPVTTFAGGTNWKQVNCGASHTAAIKTDGTLWVWGSNGVGQLGNNRGVESLTPVTTFAGGTNWKQVDGGLNITVATKTDGTLWTWGTNSQGQLGTNNTISRSTPVTTFAGGTNWKQVSCGEIRATAAIKTDGTLWVWGLNAQGQLGTNDTIDRSTPVTTFAGGTNWRQVNSSFQIAAIKTDGTLWTWGFNSNGTLGVNDSINRSTPVTTFAGGTNWKQANSGSGSHIAAIKTDGTLWIWGGNNSGRLGINASAGSSLTPVTTFAGGNNWKQVSCGQNHTAAIESADFI